MTHDFDLQRQIEGEGIARGMQRARDALARDLRSGNIVRNNTVRDMMDVALARTSEALTAWLAQEEGRVGKPHRLKVYVDLLGVETVAYVAVAAACNAVADTRTHRHVCLAIGDRIEDEARYRLLQNNAPELYDARMAKLKRTLSKRFIKASMDQAVAYAGLDTTPYELPFEERVALGLALLDGIVVPVTGLFDVVSVRVRKGAETLQDKTISWSLAATEAMWARVTDGSTYWLPPVALPCVVPPKPWGATQRGGYHFKLAGKFPLIRKGGSERNRAVRESASPLLWDALNSLQEVRWRINEDVLAVMKAAFAMPYGGCGFPAQKPVMPPKVSDAAFALMTDEQKREYRSNRRRAYEAHSLASSERSDIARLLDTAGKYLGLPMFFPYSMDFRGRLYAISSYLTPYGSDRHRGLLLFGEDAELGSKGRTWLAVHGANTIDKLDGVKVSKLSNSERVKFIEERHALLVATAADPLGNRWWASLENPWQTLAFCFEWAKLDAHVQAGGRAETFRSSLPVQMDGTCNGAQHFAAMFRDEKGGAAVNLVPADSPEDLYLRVADALLAQMKTLGAEGEEMALLWAHSGMIDRSLVKRCVMTYFYGSKQYGFKEQLLGTIEGDPKLREKAEAAFGFENKEGKEPGTVRRVPRYRAAAAFLAGRMEGALKGVVQGAHDGMLWLQGWAKVIAGRNKKVSWVVPLTGMTPEQAYMEQQTCNVRTTMFGKRLWGAAWNDTKTVLARKQVTAISPNVIHSLDTAHLMMTLAMLPGIPVGTVHDSYWSLAGHTETIRQATRRAFVQLYSLDVAGMLEGQFQAQVPDLTDDERKKLHPRPVDGTLDITGVLDSEYFFA